MNRLVLVLCLPAAISCAEPRRDPPQGSISTVSGTITASGVAPGSSAAPSGTPAPPEQLPAPSASVAPVQAADAMPAYEAGAGVLRLGVMYSDEEAKVKRAALRKIVLAPWPPIEVWGTLSGDDAKVSHRLQIKGVTPAAATALCDWLQQYKGWHPGAAKCGLRPETTP